MKAVLTCQSISEDTKVIKITGSKSESNRLLLLQALYPSISIQNLSESDDTLVLEKGLKITKGEVDVHHAGTAMRFLTAYFAAKEGREVLLTGSDRMEQRPIKILVEALKSLGATIEYVKNEGYPPLRIFGKKLIKNNVGVEANISSQYISALMLIAPSLANGLTIELEGEVTSTPYIEMTLSLLKQMDVACSFAENTIRIEPQTNAQEKIFNVESDWSSASYFYSMVALSKKYSVKLTSYSEKSLQGDAALAAIYKSLGVETTFNVEDASILLSKNRDKLPKRISLNLSNTPDIAQTIAVTCFGLGIECRLTGLHTLKIKETDRLSALKRELEKLGATICISEDTLDLEPIAHKDLSEVIKKNVIINTYQDHRMAMAFTPLALLVPLTINEPMVVTKSFPTFWEDVSKMGIKTDFQ